jgi:hypothetical protein
MFFTIWRPSLHDHKHSEPEDGTKNPYITNRVQRYHIEKHRKIQAHAQWNIIKYVPQLQREHVLTKLRNPEPTMPQWKVTLHVLTKMRNPEPTMPHWKVTLATTKKKRKRQHFRRGHAMTLAAASVKIKLPTPGQKLYQRIPFSCHTCPLPLLWHVFDNCLCNFLQSKLSSCLHMYFLWAWWLWLIHVLYRHMTVEIAF